MTTHHADDDYPLTPLERTFKELRETKARLLHAEAERDDYRQRYEKLLKKDHSEKFEEQDIDAAMAELTRETLNVNSTPLTPAWQEISDAFMKRDTYNPFHATPRYLASSPPEADDEDHVSGDKIDWNKQTRLFESFASLSKSFTKRD